MCRLPRPRFSHGALSHELRIRTMFARMRPRELLGSSLTADGRSITLHAEGSGYVVRIGNETLMTSRTHGSEEAMATAGLGAALRSSLPRVLVGGLGMGFTLRAALDLLPAHAEVVVSELLDCVVDWNRGPLSSLSADALSDPRVQLEIGDVRGCVSAPGVGFDAILLDVDNGPDAFTADANAALYAPAGLAALRAALRPGGLLTIWSASPSRPFEKALARAGFEVEVLTLRARHDSSRGARHTLFVGRACR